MTCAEFCYSVLRKIVLLVLFAQCLPKDGSSFPRVQASAGTNGQFLCNVATCVSVKAIIGTSKTAQ